MKLKQDYKYYWLCKLGIYALWVRARLQFEYWRESYENWKYGFESYKPELKAKKSSSVTFKFNETTDTE